MKTFTIAAVAAAAIALPSLAFAAEGTYFEPSDGTFVSGTLNAPVAAANEAGLDSRHIGRIGLHEESSTIELPAGMPKEAANALKRTRVRGVPINLRPDTGRTDSRPDTGERKFRKKPERE